MLCLVLRKLNVAVDLVLPFLIATASLVGRSQEEPAGGVAKFANLIGFRPTMEIFCCMICGILECTYHQNS